MKNQTTAHAYAHPHIAAELLTRLRNLNNHKDHLSRQVNAFSTIYPHPGFLSMRWYTPIASLPYPHVIQTSGNGANIDLYILISKANAVLRLKMKSNVWWIENNYKESESAAVLPTHAFCTGWQHRSPASRHQIHTLSRLLLLPVRQLPRLTGYNASLLIQEALIAPHHDEIVSLIELANTPQHKRLQRTA